MSAGSGQLGGVDRPPSRSWAGARVGRVAAPVCEQVLLLNRQAITDAGAGSSEELPSEDRFCEVPLEGGDLPAGPDALDAAGSRAGPPATSLPAPGRANTSAAEVRVDLEAIEAGNPSLAAEACATHVHNAARARLSRLADLGAAGGESVIIPS